MKGNKETRDLYLPALTSPEPHTTKIGVSFFVSCFPALVLMYLITLLAGQELLINYSFKIAKLSVEVNVSFSHQCEENL